MDLSSYVKVKVKKPIVVVDKREREYAQLLEGMGAKVVEKLLPYGDILIPPRYTLEVKRGRDVERSISDGRIFQQLREGSVLVLENPIVERPSHFFGLLAALIRKGIPVVATRSKEETALFAYRLAHQTQIKEGESPKLMDVKRSYRLEEGAKAMLMVVPGIGPKRADALLERYGSVAEVAKASKRELKALVGEKAGERLWRYLHQSTKALPDKKA